MLNSLVKYYDRLVQSNVQLPAFGFTIQGIHFAIVLNSKGKVVDVVDLRDGKKPAQLLVPAPPKGRTSSPKAGFSWDNTKYLLGAGKTDDPKNKDRHEAFKELAKKIGPMNDPVMAALFSFLDNWNPKRAGKLPFWEEMAEKNVVVKLDGKNEYLHDRQAIKETWTRYVMKNQDGSVGQCSVTGETDVPIARLQPVIKGVANTKKSGAFMGSANKPAFRHFLKKQGDVAPVGALTAHKYTAVLNRMLAIGSGQCVLLAGSTTVLWTEHQSPAEGIMAGLIDPSLLKNAPEPLQQKLYATLEAISKGLFPQDLIGDTENRCYVLTLAGNSSRVAIRNWWVGTIGQLLSNIGNHYKGLQVIKSFDSDPDHPYPFTLLSTAAVKINQKSRVDRLPPQLPGEFIKAIITGGRYPPTLLYKVIDRIRAEGEINYIRAALIKAILIRNHSMEVKPMLDTENINTGYLLGRFLAVAEKAQQVAISPNDTMGAKFLGSLGASPLPIYNRIITHTQAHMDKMRKGKNKGLAVILDKLLGEIVPQIGAPPRVLKLEDKALLASGYYAQRQEFFKRKDKEE